MKFSIVTPTWNRLHDGLLRCISSVQRQDQEFEHVIIDDGSTDGTEEVIWEMLSDKDVPYNYPLTGVGYFRQERAGRVAARNKGMELAEGEWICWLDDDDALDPMYLATFAYHIERNPAAKLWVCGAVVHGVKREDGKHTVPVWTKLRHAKKPPLIDHNQRELFPELKRDWVHDHFPSGTVGTGMFMFHRSCMEKVDLMPEWKTHYEVADGVDEWLGYETGYSAEKRWVGNPWGDDWAYFRKLTMHYEVNLIEACLYTHYVR